MRNILQINQLFYEHIFMQFAVMGKVTRHFFSNLVLLKTTWAVNRSEYPVYIDGPADCRSKINGASSLL